jgi:hypothetical protein
MLALIQRVGLALLAASAAMLGVWALLAPRSFFDDFPGSGLRLVAALPPYNEHLTRDFGSLNLALAVVIAAAAISMSRPLVVAALAAVLVNGIPHLLFHASHQGTLSDSDQAANLIGLAMPVAVAAALLFVEWWRTVDRASPAAAPSTAAHHDASVS